MRSKLKITLEMLAAAFILMGTAVCISVSVSSDAGGFSQEISADKDDTLTGRAVLSNDALYNEITLSRGSLKDRHWIAGDSGDRAEVGVDIKNANRICYSYHLDKGSDYASAEETITAIDARSIKAYAKAESNWGDEAESRITISDKNKEASLMSYSNYAYAASSDDDAGAIAGQLFDSAAGDHITIDELSRQSDGDMALASMSIAGGRINSYYGAASAMAGGYGYHYEYGNESGYWLGSWDGASANHYGNISGRSIDVTELAARWNGETAQARTNIQSGQVVGYNGNASVWLELQKDSGVKDGTDFLDEQWLDTTWVSHGALDLGGERVLFEEAVRQRDGDVAGAGFRATGVPQADDKSLPYFGGAEAAIKNASSWDGYRSCNKNSNLAWSYHFGDIAGRRIDLDEWSRKSGGGQVKTRARIVDGYTWFNSSAGTDLGCSICHDPEVVDVVVTDKSWAYQDMVGLNGQRMYLTAKANSRERAIESARLERTIGGNYLTVSRAEILSGYPSAEIYVDWLPNV